jgi:hypothetical protein
LGRGQRPHHHSRRHRSEHAKPRDQTGCCRQTLSQVCDSQKLHWFRRTPTGDSPSRNIFLPRGEWVSSCRGHLKTLSCDVLGTSAQRGGLLPGAGQDVGVPSCQWSAEEQEEHTCLAVLAVTVVCGARRFVRSFALAVSLWQHQPASAPTDGHRTGEQAAPAQSATCSVIGVWPV